jgi:hypothetical protein
MLPEGTTILPPVNTTNDAIAEHLLAVCLDAGHKPGKVQFTKYLYQLDYCHYRYTGQKATSLPWKFYHYGPWCEAADTTMTALAQQYGFHWREEEESVIRSVEIAKPRMPILVSGLINRIVETFKDKDLNVLLDVSYFQTEPMVEAQRGSLLDFHNVPITKTFPQYFQEATKPTPYVLPHEFRERMAALKARGPQLKAKFKEEEEIRRSPSFQRAMELLSQELSSEPIPEIKVTLTPDAAEGLSRD